LLACREAQPLARDGCWTFLQDASCQDQGFRCSGCWSC